MENRDAIYDRLLEEAPAYFTSYWLSNMANLSALIFELVPDLNWVGFYLNRNEELILGPFQGKVACLQISFDRGVCGAAARERKTQIVADVHEFAGHIACDSASESEVVIPLIKDGRLLGVLDVDSPKLARFTQHDAAQLEKIVDLLIQKTEWPAQF